MGSALRRCSKIRVDVAFGSSKIWWAGHVMRSADTIEQQRHRLDFAGSQKNTRNPTSAAVGRFCSSLCPVMIQYSTDQSNVRRVVMNVLLMSSRGIK